MDANNFVVGYLLSEKCINHLAIHSELKDLCLPRGITFHEIQEDIPIEQQGPYNAIIHKCSDYLRTSLQGNKLHERIIKDFLDYPVKNPSTVVIDSPYSVLLLANREKMLQICDECQFVKNGIKVFVPNWIAVESISGLKDRLQERNIKFPVLFKAHSAAEGEGAHDMQLVFNEDQFDSLTVLPSVAQQFENHGGILYKIFAVGKKFCIITRPSIKDINLENCCIQEEMKESILFCSHEVSKPAALSFLNNYQEDYVERYSYGEKDSILDYEVISEILSVMTDKLSYNLLGIDIILNSNGDYGIIDVNYFPSFDGMKNSVDLIAERIYDLVTSKEIESDKILMNENNRNFEDKMTHVNFR